MPTVSDIWRPSLNQTGPPCWANNPVQVPMMICRNLEHLRGLCISPSQQRTPSGEDIPSLVMLLGEYVPYDGLLQGIYMAYPPSASDPDNGGSTIYSDHGKHRWKKLGT